MNIVIYDYRGREWTSSSQILTPIIRNTFTQYKERENLFREIPFNNSDFIVYRPNNNPYMPTYIAPVYNVLMIAMTNDLPVQNNGTVTISQDIHDRLEYNEYSIPIIDLNDIYVFTTRDEEGQRANWVPARSYQIWAYRDFLYDRNHHIRKSYKSRGTYQMVYENDTQILANQIVTIDLENITPNIVFNIIRADDSSVYIERNDTIRSRMRICDNEYARRGYLGFYTRLTMDPGIIVIPTPPPPLIIGGGNNIEILSVSHISPLEETDNDDNQCILCANYRVNVCFSPCEHKCCCSSCYSKFAKNECPLCRVNITRVMNV